MSLPSSSAEATATAVPVHGAEEAPSPAVAPPPGSPRFALFDSLRGLAVFSILVFHVFSLTGSTTTPIIGDAVTMLGPRAVIWFFVISGFLLYRPYVAARVAERSFPRTTRYARRRLLRILPAYWVALTALAIFPGIVGVFTDDWWRYYFFLQLYSHDTLGFGIPVAWTLGVEVAFYIALPLWAAAVRRLRIGSGPRAWLRGELVALGLVAAGGVVVQVAASRQAVSDLVASSLAGQCTWLALGMALAVASVAVEYGDGRSRTVRFVTEHPGLCWIGAAAAFAGLTALLHNPGGLLGIIVALQTEQPIPKTLAGIALTAVESTLLVLPAVFGERAGGFPRRVLAWAPLAWLGLISYSAYLWHLTVAQFLILPADPGHFSASGLGLAKRIPVADTPILILMTLAVTCAVAAASYYFVELPFLRRKER